MKAAIIILFLKLGNGLIKAVQYVAS